MQQLTGLAPILKNYDALILDLWGVIHDGTHLYPGVDQALTGIKEQGKKICLLSNAPRRVRKVEAVLGGLGVRPSLYDFVHSSGEMGYQWLASKANTVGNRYYFIGPDKDLDVTQGLDFMQVDDLSKASFILNVGFGSEEQTTNDYTEILANAARRSKTMICLNPDLEVVKQSGERFPCAGVIAHEYAKIGGKVLWFGKPFPTIYKEVVQQLGVPKERILAIGDSLDTDIAGAQRAGIDSVLVTGGILRDLSIDQVLSLASEKKFLPTYVIGALTL